MREINYGDCYMYPIPKMNKIIKGITDNAAKTAETVESLNAAMEDLTDDVTQMSETVGILNTVKTGSIEAVEGFTFSELEVKQHGKIVNISGYVTAAENWAASEVTIGSVTGVDKPTKNKRTLCGSGTAAYSAVNAAYMMLSTTGAVIVRVPTAANKVLTFNVCYIVE